VLECEISALLITELGHTFLESSVMWRLSRQNARVTDAQHLRLLRPRRERPGSPSAAEQCDEVAPSHVNLARRGTKPINGQRCASQQNWLANDAVGQSRPSWPTRNVDLCPLSLQ